MDECVQSLGARKAASQAHILLDSPLLALWVGLQQSPLDPSGEWSPKNRTSYSYCFPWWETQRIVGSFGVGWLV